MTAKERADAILALVPAKKRAQALELLRAQWHEADLAGRRTFARVCVEKWEAKKFRIAELQDFLSSDKG